MPSQLLTLHAMIVAGMLLFSATQANAEQPPSATLQQYLSRQTTNTSREEARIDAAVRDLYQRLDYPLIWEDPQLFRQLAQGVADSHFDGLSPADYPLPRAPLESGALFGENTADFDALMRRDVMLSHSFMRLLSHLYFGKVDPTLTHSDWNLADQRHLDDDPELVPGAIRAGDIRALMNQARPQQRFYQRLKEKLEVYREIAAAGGWPPLPAVRTLSPGDSDATVPALRHRLALTGDYQGDSGATGTDYDPQLVTAVEQFQRRHLLEDDGIIGPDTWQALNIPVTAKIGQIRANLERMRWALKGLEGEFLLVDIAGYAVHLVSDDAVIWSSPVQVGKPYRETPVFSSTVSYLEWNPTWTVPPTILAQDVIPAIKRDPDYLRRKNMVVLTYGGERIDPSSIDWSLYPERNFPYLIRQLAGPSNALGQVKFIFPNKHAVYLHDTPSKHLFKESSRAFSSGCIRVGQPFELAKRLLAPQQDLTDADIDAILASGETRREHLQQGFPIIILYWTTKWLPDGSLVFAPDIYQRDAKILAALDSPELDIDAQAAAAQAGTH